MVPREAPITETMDKVAEDLKAAQSALKDGAGQEAGRGDTERSLAQLERLRSQMERMAGRGQNGQQQGNSRAASKTANSRAVNKPVANNLVVNKPAASRLADSKVAADRSGKPARRWRSRRSQFGPGGNRYGNNSAVANTHMADSCRKECTTFPTNAPWILSA